MAPIFVSKKNIDLVIDGLENFLQQTIRAQQFSAVDMKNFMEPIFSRASYRDPVTNGRGAVAQSNILILNNGGVGDFIINSAAIREIRRLYPTAHITLVFFARAFDLAEVCPYVDEIVPNEQHFAFDDPPMIYRWDMSVARRLLRRRYDAAYSFVSQGSTVLLSYMSGAKVRISHKYGVNDRAVGAPIDFPLYAVAPLLTVEVPRNFSGATHEVEDYLGLLDYTLHAPIANRELEIWYTPMDRTAAENLLTEAGGEKFYVLCMGGSAPRKQWQPDRYAQLVMKILEREPDIKFLILGGGSTDEQSAAIFKQTLGDRLVNAHVLDLTNRINYRRSAAILRLCDLYIGNDTGTMHMAAAVKTPVLSPNCFAADLPMRDDSIPKVFYPCGVPSVIVQPKHALSDCKGSTESFGCTHYERHCIAQIAVDKMFEGYRRLKERIAANNIEPLFIS